jgi:hypothetical protein
LVAQDEDLAAKLKKLEANYTHSSFYQGLLEYEPDALKALLMSEVCMYNHTHTHTHTDTHTCIYLSVYLPICMCVCVYIYTINMYVCMSCVCVCIQ